METNKLNYTKLHSVFSALHFTEVFIIIKKVARFCNKKMHDILCTSEILNTTHLTPFFNNTISI